MNNELLTVSEAAALLRLKPSTIRAWTCQRKIPFVKIGRLVRIRRSDAEAFIQASRVESVVRA
jgi:excisionase family DNA binding protein